MANKIKLVEKVACVKFSSDKNLCCARQQCVLVFNIGKFFNSRVTCSILPLTVNHKPVAALPF